MEVAAKILGNLARGFFIIAAATAFMLNIVLGAQAASYKIPRDHGPTTKVHIKQHTNERPGTIVISNSARTLDVVIDSNTIARYSIGIGRDKFTWTGVVTVGRKAEWPSWRPPAEMRARQPNLPKSVLPGPHNPLGARALYLFKDGRDTLYRIHGTNDAASIGGQVTSGCFRLTNADVLELYRNIPSGTKVIVRD